MKKLEPREGRPWLKTTQTTLPRWVQGRDRIPVSSTPVWSMSPNPCVISRRPFWVPRCVSKFTEDPPSPRAAGQHARDTRGDRTQGMRLASLTSESLKSRAASLSAVFSILQMEMSHPLQQLLDFPDARLIRELIEIDASEISQTEKDKHCMISLLCGI